MGEHARRKAGDAVLVPHQDLLDGAALRIEGDVRDRADALAARMVQRLADEARRSV